jgi:AcrR family transcriptional regulator
MQNKRGKNTKKKIVSAAWKLFYEQGYDNTTIDEIIELSETSKGSFYHYFEGKDALLSSLSFLFDEKYEELIPTLSPDMGCLDKLLYINQELFSLIESTIPLDLLARLYSTQLTTKGEKHLLDHNRTYYKLLRQIVLEGQSNGELRTDMTVNEITKLYALCERALMYDWCICNGDYSLKTYAKTIMPMFLSGIRAENGPES